MNHRVLCDGTDAAACTGTYVYCNDETDSCLMTHGSGAWSCSGTCFQQTNAPTPDVEPTNFPTILYVPSSVPTQMPTDVPSPSPSPDPSHSPTDRPSSSPTEIPTNPTEQPTLVPTNPSQNPTNLPTALPTDNPSQDPTNRPTGSPTDVPTGVTEEPTSVPTKEPNNVPSPSPTLKPTNTPSTMPTHIPSDDPTDRPSISPSSNPTQLPTDRPTPNPTDKPTNEPTSMPTSDPSVAPSDRPTNSPSNFPTAIPTDVPVISPTEIPSDATAPPTHVPTVNPTDTTDVPSRLPTSNPSAKPTDSPNDSTDSGGIDTTDSDDNDSGTGFGASSGGEDDMGVIIGVSVGGVAICIVIGILGVLFYRKKKINEQNKAIALQKVFKNKKLGTTENGGSPISDVNTPASHSGAYTTTGGGAGTGDDFNMNVFGSTPGGPDDGPNALPATGNINTSRLVGINSSTATASVVVTDFDNGNKLQLEEGRGGNNNNNNNYNHNRDEFIDTDADGLVHDEEKEVEYVTPGGPDDMGDSKYDDDNDGADMSQSSEAEMAKIRNEMVTHTAVNAANHDKRDSEALHIEIANLMAEQDQKNTGQNGSGMGTSTVQTNSDMPQPMQTAMQDLLKQSDATFGIVLNDGLMVADMVVDDIVSEMNDEANGVAAAPSSTDYVTPGGPDEASGDVGNEGE